MCRKELDKLRELITVTIQEKINDKNLFKALKDEFIYKGLNVVAVSNLRENSLDEKIDINEMIAITKVLKRELGDERFLLSKYFTPGEIEHYNASALIEENIIDYALIKNVTKIDNFNYHCVISAKQLYELRKNQVIRYNPEYQRAPKIVRTASGKVYKRADINKQGLDDLNLRYTDTAKGINPNKSIRPTSISIAIMSDSKKLLSENFTFKPLYNDLIGDLYIKPVYDIDSEEKIQLNIIDGAHRYFALTDAYEEMLVNSNLELDYSLGCYIYIMDREAAKQLVVDAFKRNDTDLDYLKSLESSDENTFIELLGKESKWLNGHIANTKRELKLEYNYTQKKTLIDAFKNTDISMKKDDLGSELARTDIASLLDKTLDYILNTIFKGDLNEMRKSIFLSDNIFKLYIRFLNEIKDDKSNAKAISCLVEYLMEHRYFLINKLDKGGIDNDLESIINEVKQWN